MTKSIHKKIEIEDSNIVLILIFKKVILNSYIFPFLFF